MARTRHLKLSMNTYVYVRRRSAEESSLDSQRSGSYMISFRPEQPNVQRLRPVFLACDGLWIGDIASNYRSHKTP